VSDVLIPGNDRVPRKGPGNSRIVSPGPSDQQISSVASGRARGNRKLVHQLNMGPNVAPIALQVSVGNELRAEMPQAGSVGGNLVADLRRYRLPPK